MLECECAPFFWGIVWGVFPQVKFKYKWFFGMFSTFSSGQNCYQALIDTWCIAVFMSKFCDNALDPSRAKQYSAFQFLKLEPKSPSANSTSVLQSFTTIAIILHKIDHFMKLYKYTWLMFQKKTDRKSHEVCRLLKLEVRLNSRKTRAHMTDQDKSRQIKTKQKRSFLFSKETRKLKIK